MELYTIEGTISADGKILSGDGFTVTHCYTGVYIVKFDHPFFYQAPEISIDISSFSAGANALVIDKNLKAFKCFTRQVEQDFMYLEDFEFNFSATGMKN